MDESSKCCGSIMPGGQGPEMRRKGFTGRNATGSVGATSAADIAAGARWSGPDPAAMEDAGGAAGGMEAAAAEAVPVCADAACAGALFSQAPAAGAGPR